MKQSYARNGPAILFNNDGTDYSLVAGVYSNREKALLAFEADAATILDNVLPINNFYGIQLFVMPIFSS